MPIYDRPSDLQTNITSPPGSTRTTQGGMSPSLSDQTPGLDTSSRARNLAMRPVSWARERPEMAISIIGGLIVIGIGTWLAVRSRRVSRLEAIKCKAEDLYGWLRSKI
jgi:hypothetical protein